MVSSFGNVQSSFLNRTFNLTSILLQSSMEKIATTYRINRAADDAAGLSISDRLTTQIISYNQSSRNAQDGYSMMSIADGAASNITESLQRIRELTVQAGNSTEGTAERTAINNEINQRIDDIDMIANNTKFNKINLLNDQVPTSVKLQVGPNAGENIDISSALGDARSTALGLTAATINLSTPTAATNFLTQIDNALSNISARRSNIGSTQNRLNSVIDSIDVASMNISAARSRIRDLDIATETSYMVRLQLIQQSTVALMGQNNSNMANITMSLIKNN
jgi:flagellin